MITFSVTGGKKMREKFAEIKKGLVSKKVMKAGYFAEDVYPDNGEFVADVAALQNFGDPEKKIPPRPFFTFAAEKLKKDIGVEFGDVLVGAGYDKDITLSISGEISVSYIREEIKNLHEPELSDKTIAYRLERLSMGEPAGLGGIDKPLMDTLKMYNSTKYKVE